VNQDIKEERSGRKGSGVVGWVVLGLVTGGRVVVSQYITEAESGTKGSGVVDWVVFGLVGLRVVVYQDVKEGAAGT
jgi:hypothetical protein